MALLRKGLSYDADDLGQRQDMKLLFEVRAAPFPVETTQIEAIVDGLYFGGTDGNAEQIVAAGVGDSDDPFAQESENPIDIPIQRGDSSYDMNMPNQRSPREEGGKESVEATRVGFGVDEVDAFGPDERSHFPVDSIYGSHEGLHFGQGNTSFVDLRAERKTGARVAVDFILFRFQPERPVFLIVEKIWDVFLPVQTVDEVEKDEFGPADSCGVAQK